MFTNFLEAFSFFLSDCTAGIFFCSFKFSLCELKASLLALALSLSVFFYQPNRHFSLVPHAVLHQKLPVLLQGRDEGDQAVPAMLAMHFVIALSLSVALLVTECLPD